MWHVHRFQGLGHGHVWGLLFCLPQSALWFPKIHVHPARKINLPSINVSKNFNPLQHQVKAQNLIQLSWSYSVMGEILGVIHTGAKFVFICNPMELGNMLSAPRIEWWDKQLQTFWFKKGESGKEEGVISLMFFPNYIRFQGLGISLCDSAPLSGPWTPPWESSFLFNER